MIMFVCAFNILFFLIVCNAKLKQKKLIKTSQKFKLGFLKVQSIFSQNKMGLNFFGINQMDVFGSFEKLKICDNIVSCCKFNSIEKSLSIKDKGILKKIQVDQNKSVCVFGDVNKRLMECIITAKKFVDFNVLICGKMCNKNCKKIDAIKVDLKNKNIASVVKKINVLKGDNFKRILNEKHKNKILLSTKNDKFEIDNINTSKSIFCKNIKCEINSFENKFVIDIENKLHKKHNILINYFYNLNIFNNNYFKFKKINNNIKIINLITKKVLYFFINKNVKYKFSQINNQKNSNLPCFCFKLELNLDINEKTKVVFGFSEKILNEQLILNKLNKIKNKYNNLFDIKIKTSNLKIDNLFNYILPKQINYNDFLTIKKFNFNSFDDAYKSFLSCKISPLDLYLFLKFVYFGIIKNLHTIKFYPLCDFDFLIAIKHQNCVYKIWVKSGENHKYIFVNNLKILNINFINLQSLKIPSAIVAI